MASSYVGGNTTAMAPMASSTKLYRISLLALSVSCSGGPAQGVGQDLVGGEFRLKRTTIDGGAGTVAGDGFVLRGTIAQPDAFVSPAVGASFAVSGGFWRGLGVGGGDDLLFRDGFELQ